MNAKARVSLVKGKFKITVGAKKTMLSYGSTKAESDPSRCTVRDLVLGIQVAPRRMLLLGVCFCKMPSSREI